MRERFPPIAGRKRFTHFIFQQKFPGLFLSSVRRFTLTRSRCVRIGVVRMGRHFGGGVGRRAALAAFAFAFDFGLPELLELAKGTQRDAPRQRIF